MSSDGPSHNPEMPTVARESRGLSIAELAELASVSTAMLSRVEGGIRQPSPEALSRIADALGYPESFLRQA